VGNELGSYELTYELGKVRCNRGHSVFQIFGEILTVVSNLDDLVCECLQVTFVLFQDFGTHGDFGGLSYLLGDFLWNDFKELFVSEILDVGPHTNKHYGLRVGHVIGDDLGKFGEVPRVPFFESHCVVVELLIEVFKKGHGLNNHSIDFVAAERELVAGDGVS